MYITYNKITYFTSNKQYETRQAPDFKTILKYILPFHVHVRVCVYTLFLSSTDNFSSLEFLSLLVLNVLLSSSDEYLILNFTQI